MNDTQQSTKTQLTNFLRRQVELNRLCQCYTPNLAAYGGKVYYVQEITTMLPNGRIASVEAMYLGADCKTPEEFTARELANYRRLASALDVLVSETSPLLED